MAMDHRGGGGGGGRSSSRLRDRLARMFRPGALLRSTCNNHATASTSSSSSSAAAAAGGVVTASACSSSRALLAADAAAAVDYCGRESFLASSRRDYSDAAATALVGRTESFSTALDRLHRRGGGTPLPPSRFSVDAPPPPPPTTRHQIRRKRRAARASSCVDTCGVRDGFRPVVSAAEEQVRRGFAVVKRSRDPYADFRSSMVEMVVGRQLFGAAELERLLRSYLSLNAPRHHPVILQAFSDIWVVLHGG
ncbi:unknown protein [Oryza sativa Japonica Group]|uniref:Transcription repressor n=2 Tax=Oryza sativa subsp. japonica TaxID=39947 RepID=Q0JPE7_ORYSJ|nr:unknown protein [Oryza sativa Japonica Group]BAF04381.1 Os01g0226700 [Oryza sativa Japonica Group]BAS71125.1 Os01g0226700 [Oryza sativa Japonica Group]|eukprot:NP_001042467.1 Os01g0226700 [Oryza sativa Japonica Group]